MKIKILDEARDDIAIGIRFYDSQNYGLGGYFLDSIMSDIESLHLYCGVHVKIKNYHRLLSKRFPYAIYYKYDDNTIYIYAVLDCRRNPLFISKRLS